MPHAPAPVQQVQEPPLLNVSTLSEVAALRAELTKIRLELSLVNDKAQLATSRAMAISTGPDHQAFDRQFAELRDRSDRQVILINDLSHALDRHKTELRVRMGALRSNVSNMLAVVEASKAGGGQQ
jgi:hypothetical protein